MNSRAGAAHSWDAAAYDKHARFVSDLGAEILSWLDPKPGERILDVGCGDGALTQRLVDAGAEVVGVDTSDSLLAAALERGLDVRRMDGQDLQFDAEFDAVGGVKEIVSVTRLERLHEVSFNRIFKDDRELALKSPIRAFVDFVEGMWTMENEDLGIVASGEDYESCLADFQDEFFLAWDEYAHEDDDTLTEDARLLKQRILLLVRG